MTIVAMAIDERRAKRKTTTFPGLRRDEDQPRAGSTPRAARHGRRRRDADDE